MPQDSARKIGITDTTMRDGHQSLLATRISTNDLLEIAGMLDDVGFHSCEVWGGATFDSCMRFLDEDPWDRLRKLRQAMPKTKLQMLLRGQNLVGYRHYADDVVDEFIKCSAANGIDIVRIFDALNDVRNVDRALQAAKKEGVHAQVAVSYTISPIHTVERFAEKAAIYADMGADSICIKDMAGLLRPYPAYELVKAIKERTGLMVQVHSHYTTGQAAMTYLKAIEAGADVVDCAMSALALGTSQPAVAALVAALQDTPYDTGIDINKLHPINEKLKVIRSHYKQFDTTSVQVDSQILRYQMPGGMISNFINQLREAKALNRLQQVLDEVPRVREDMGYPPLVTPTSQIVGTQAVLNVLGGERYKLVSNEVKAYFRGEYGQPPAPMNEEVQKKIIGDAEPITCRPADLLDADIPNAEKEIGAYCRSSEDLLLYLMFPQVADRFVRTRYLASLVGDTGNVDEEYNPV